MRDACKFEIAQIVPFTSGEEAWGYYCKFQRHRNSGCRPNGGNGINRPCSPQDIGDALIKMIRLKLIPIDEAGALWRAIDVDFCAPQFSIQDVCAFDRGVEKLEQFFIRTGFVVKSER